MRNNALAAALAGSLIVSVLAGGIGVSEAVAEPTDAPSAYHPTIAWVDSEESAETAPNGRASALVDDDSGRSLQDVTFWTTGWKDDVPGYPHAIVMERAGEAEVCGIQYTARPSYGTVHGASNAPGLFDIYAFEQVPAKPDDMNAWRAAAAEGQVPGGIKLMSGGLQAINDAQDITFAGSKAAAFAIVGREAVASEKKQMSASDIKLLPCEPPVEPGAPGEGGGSDALVHDLFVDQLPFGEPGKPAEFEPSRHTYDATAYYHTDRVSLRVQAVSGAVVTIAGRAPDALGRASVRLAVGVNPVTVEVTKGGESATYVVNIRKVETDFRGHVKAPASVVANGASASENTALTDGNMQTFWQAGNAKSDEWSESVTGMTIALPEARDISRVTAFARPEFSRDVAWWHGGVGVSIAVQAHEGGPWKLVAQAASLRRDAGGIMYWDFNSYHRAKNIRIWFNDRTGGEVPSNTELSGARFYEVEAWGMPAGVQPPQVTPPSGDSLPDMFDPGDGKWGVSRAQTLALEHGILLPAWIPSQGYARGAMDAREQRLSGGAIPMFYDPPLFNSDVMARLAKSPWALAKAPSGGNSMHANPTPHDFLTPEMRPYAKNLVEIQYGDEGGYSAGEVELFGKWFEFSKKTYPGAIVHSNQNENPSWGNLANMRTYVREAKPDLLSWDTYYFGGGGVFGSHGPKAPSQMVGLLNSNMWKVQRQASLEGISGDGSDPILYGQYLDYSFDANVSQSQKSIIPMLSLASGHKWFGLFRMEYNGFDFGSLIDHDGAPTRAFYEYAKVFDDVKGFGKYLVALNNRFVAIQGGTYEDRGPKDVPKGWAMDSFGSARARPVSAEFGVIDVRATNRGSVNAGRPGDVVLGYFDKLPGLQDDKTAEIFGPGVSEPKAMMVVNSLAGTTTLPSTLLNPRTDNGAYWQTMQDITLTLAKPTADAKLMMIDPSTYEPAEVTAAGRAGDAPSEADAGTVEVTVRLGGGQGALLYWSAPNAAPEVPAEPSAVDKIGTPFHPAPVWVDSEARAGESAPNGLLEAAFDGTDRDPDLATFWHSEWTPHQPPFPHAFVVDKGQRGPVCGLVYAPRSGSQDGPRNVSVFGGAAAPETSDMPTAEGRAWRSMTKLVDAEFAAQGDEQIIEFRTDERYIGLALWDNHSDKPFTSLADLRLIECKKETPEPTAEPTSEPTSGPTGEPTAQPTGEPTSGPTGEPTSEPTAEPTTEAAARPALPRTGGQLAGLALVTALLASGGIALIRRGHHF